MIILTTLQYLCFVIVFSLIYVAIDPVIYTIKTYFYGGYGDLIVSVLFQSIFLFVIYKKMFSRSDISVKILNYSKKQSIKKSDIFKYYIKIYGYIDLISVFIVLLIVHIVFYLLPYRENYMYFHKNIISSYKIFTLIPVFDFIPNTYSIVYILNFLLTVVIIYIVYFLLINYFIRKSIEDIVI